MENILVLTLAVTFYIRHYRAHPIGFFIFLLFLAVMSASSL
jgi:hypothetical protein